MQCQDDDFIQARVVETKTTQAQEIATKSYFAQRYLSQKDFCLEIQSGSTKLSSPEKDWVQKCLGP